MNNSLFHMHECIFSLHLTGVSSILGAINFITTIINIKPPALFSIPNTTLRMVCPNYSCTPSAIPSHPGHQNYHTTDRQQPKYYLLWPRRRRRPYLYQHLFWFFGHPEVCILILPRFESSPTLLPTTQAKKNPSDTWVWSALYQSVSWALSCEPDKFHE